VHVANVLEETPPSGTLVGGNKLDGAYLTKIGVADELPIWSDLAQERLTTRLAR
jgi:hypothetical protein